MEGEETMNAERLRLLADHIEKVGAEGRFDMTTYAIVPNDGRGVTVEEIRCGTVGCIAGHAVLLFGSNEDVVRCVEYDTWYHAAREILDMEKEDGMRLFYGKQWLTKHSMYSMAGDTCSPEEAARELRALADRGGYYAR